MHRSTKGKICPRCGSKDLQLQETLNPRVSVIVCLTCDHEFEVGGHREKPRGSVRDGSEHRREVRIIDPAEALHNREGGRKGRTS